MVRFNEVPSTIIEKMVNQVELLESLRKVLRHEQVKFSTLPARNVREMSCESMMIEVTDLRGPKHHHSPSQNTIAQTRPSDAGS